MNEVEMIVTRIFSHSRDVFNSFLQGVFMALQSFTIYL